MGFSSGNGNFAGVLGSSDGPGSTGVIGRAEGPSIGGFFESSGRSALVTGHGNVGIGIQVPEAADRNATNKVGRTTKDNRRLENKAGTVGNTGKELKNPTKI